MKRFENRKVVVTGSSEGVGRQIALQFAVEGAFVVLVNRSKPDVTIGLIEKARAKCDYVICDISNEEQVVAMGKKIGEICNGKVDILINNAGFNGKANLVKDMKLEDWNKTLGINITGTMMVSREIIPYLINNGSGKIVNMASNVGKRGLPLRCDYVCSNWARIGFTQTLALELVDHNIRVNAVCPGPIEGTRIEQLVKMHADAEGLDFDDMHKAWENVPMKRFVKPQEVANVILFLASDDSSAMTGQSLNITGGLIMS
jgi:NAD(P)-dependent dehydrogenase (short-subunit alcohol dehydrogenase family)